MQTSTDAGGGGVVADASSSSALDPSTDASPLVAPDAAVLGTTPDAQSDSAPPLVPCTALPGKATSLIDDGSWPSPNAMILPQCGRLGAWRVANDGASAQTPLAGGAFGPFFTDTPPNGTSGYVRTWGSLSGTASETAHWGALVGFDLDAASGTAIPYDLAGTGFQGFSFWVRIGAANQLSSIVFNVPTRETVHDADGAFHGYIFAAPGSGAWTKITVPFSSLQQPVWTPPGELTAFDSSAAISMEWNFDSLTTPGLIFDVAIGDVELW